MKWLIALGMLLGAGFGGYRVYDSSTAPVKHYEKFAEEVLHRHYDEAVAMCDGLNREAIESQGTMEHIGAGPTMFQTLFDSRFDVQSRETTPEGTVNLKAVQTVLFNPAGVESALRPAMYATMNQLVGLRKSGGGWKVVSFKNDFVSMGSYRP